jgi:hypothetical protein
MYGAVLAAGNAERVLCRCAPVIAPVAAQEFLLPVGDDPLGFPALARTGKYTRETPIAQTPKPPELSLKPLPLHGPLRLKRKSEPYPQ